MNELEKLSLIDEHLDSWENLVTLFHAVKHYPEAKAWLQETMQHLDSEVLVDDEKNMIPSDYLNKEIR